MKNVLIEKVEDREQPIPTVWGSALKQLADKAVLDIEIKASSEIEIGLVDSKTESSHRYNIDGYPDTLGSLSEQSWNTSIYYWAPPYWQVLMGLTNINGQITDLVMHAKIYETDRGFLIEPGLIYVP